LLRPKVDERLNASTATLAEANHHEAAASMTAPTAAWNPDAAPKEKLAGADLGLQDIFHADGAVAVKDRRPHRTSPP